MPSKCVMHRYHEVGPLLALHDRIYLSVCVDARAYGLRIDSGGQRTSAMVAPDEIQVLIQHTDFCRMDCQMSGEDGVVGDFSVFFKPRVRLHELGPGKNLTPWGVPSNEPSPHGMIRRGAKNVLIKDRAFIVIQVLGKFARLGKVDHEVLSRGRSQLPSHALQCLL